MAANGGRRAIPERKADRGLPGEDAGAGKLHPRWRLGSILMGTLIVAVVAVALGANSWKRDLPVSGVRTVGNAIVPTSEILKLAAIPKTSGSLQLISVRSRGGYGRILFSGPSRSIARGRRASP